MISRGGSRLTDYLRQARQRPWQLRDTSYRTGEALAAGLGVPVLAVVPEMLTVQQRKVRHARRWRWRIAIAAACVCAAAAVWTIFG